VAANSASGAASSSGYNNDEPLINALLDKSGDSEDTVFVLLKFKDIAGVENQIVCLDGRLEDNVGTLKAQIQDKHSIPQDKQRFVFKTKPLPDNRTLASLANETTTVDGHKVIHLALELIGGMGPKGAKKVKKAEKLSMLKASSMYKTSHLNPADQQRLSTLISDPQALTAKMQTLTLPQLEAMQSSFNGWTRSTDTAVCEVLAPFIMPEITEHMQRIDDMKTQIQTFETRLEAAHSAIVVLFAEMYYNEQQYDYNQFYQDLDDRIEALKTQQAADERRELERQVQVALARAAAAGNMDEDL
jgi:ribosomal protein S13